MARDNTFYISLIISCALHLLFIVLLLLNVSHSKTLDLQEQVIAFETLPLSSIANVKPKEQKTVSPSKKTPVAKNVQEVPKHNNVKDADKKQAQKLDQKPTTQSTDNTTPKQIVQKKIEQPEKKQSKQPIKQTALKQDKASQSKPKAMPKQEKQEPKKSLQQSVNQQQKKNTVENKKESSNDELDKILKNLEQSKAEDNDNEKIAQGNYDETLGLSQTEKDLIEKQVSNQWNIPIGVKNIEQVRIVMFVNLGMDGSVISAKVIDKICPNVPHDSCNIIADSALRALYKASPINNLSVNRYNLWKAFSLNFDLIQILQLKE